MIKEANDYSLNEAVQMISLVEECLSSGVASQFSDSALAGLSASLRRARLLLGDNISCDFDKELISQRPLIGDSEFGVDAERMSFLASKIEVEQVPTKELRKAASNADFYNKSFSAGRMGKSGPKINMSRKRLRTALND